MSVLTEPLSTVRELLYHIHFRLSTLFFKVFKKFLKSLSLLLKAFSVFSNLSVVCAFLKRLRYYITPFYKLQPLFSIFLNYFHSILYVVTEKEGFEPSRRVSDLHP